MTINLSLPEDLTILLPSIVADPSQQTPEAALADVSSEEIEGEHTMEEACKVVSETPEVQQPSAKILTIPPADVQFALYLAESNEIFNCVYL